MEEYSESADNLQILFQTIFFTSYPIKLFLKTRFLNRIALSLPPPALLWRAAGEEEKEKAQGSIAMVR